MIVYSNKVQDTGNDYKFTGREYDDENALQYFGARYLGNDIARFYSLDPVIINIGSITDYLSDPQSLNTYAYARNNPVILLDADGRSWGTFFYGLGTGIIVATVVAGAIAVAPIAIPAGIITALAVGGTGAVMYGTYSNYQAYNNGSISKDEFDYNAGSLLGGLVAPSIASKSLGKVGAIAGEAGDAVAPKVKALPDEAIVCRGGSCTAEAFRNGSGITEQNGKLYGISTVSAENKTVQELSELLPHNKVGFTTAGEIRKLGGEVFRTGDMNNFHTTVSGLSAEDAEMLFRPNVFKKINN